MQNDIDIVTKYLFTDMTIKNLELDLQHIKNGPFKIKEPYIKLIENAISKAIKERGKLKGLMYQREMQVLFLHSQNNFSTYKFILGGYEQEKTYNNQVIKNNVKEIMTELFEDG